ncbi:Glycoside hydrolase family 76 protein [Mycena kentingensis (nom. inval.)]|nr:Glycoside hydrolase family 76 protein [Mycena kentingensis (nom. inval.)]
MFIDVVASSIPEDPCPGGVWWVPDTPSKGKNTITAALFIHASTMYYSITKTASYLTNAQTVYNWIQKSGANNSDGIYFDGPQSPNCGFTKGEMLAAMGALYAATGDKDYLNAGNATLHALTTSADFNVNGTLFEHTCDADECTGGNKNDNAWAFKGIAMRSVQYFLDAANDPAITSLYSPWIAFQATSINANAKNTDNDDIGNVWTRRGAQVFGASPMGMAVNAANAAVKYGANDGTFVC